MHVIATKADRSADALVTERITERIFFAAFIAALAWVPFWYGSDRPIAWSINAIIFPGLAVLYEASLLIRRQRHPIEIRTVWPSALLFAAVAAWILLQNATWVPAAWQHPVWTRASDALGVSVPGSISLDRDLTTLALIRLLTSASAFWVVLQLASAPYMARWFTHAVSVIISVYSLIGIAAFGLTPEHAVFPEFGKVNVLSSTFFNRNTYATFAGMGIIATLAMVLYIYQRELAEADNLVRLRIALFIKTTGGKAAFSLALLFINVAGLLMSASRGGILATLAGVLLLGLLTLRSAERRGARTMSIVIPVAFFLVAISLTFGDVFLSRLEDQGLLDQNRLIVQKLTMVSILRSPWVGYGYGTFAAVFPMLRDNAVGLWEVWDRAHNTYLEVLQGLGLPFGCGLILSVAFLSYRCLSAATRRQHAFNVSSIAAAVSCLVGLHAFTDFSLQVQAVPLFFMTILAVGVAHSLCRSADHLSPAVLRLQRQRGGAS